MIIKFSFSSRKLIESHMNSYSNIPIHILNQTDKNIYKNNQHPLGILKNTISDFFLKKDFKVLDNLNKIVEINKNFDELLVPKDHPSRKKSESYYLNENLMLRPHTSVHQIETLKKGINNFILFGDVYRRDTIDSSHYPIFHQMEAVKIFQNEKDDKIILQDLKQTTEDLIKYLFGNIQMRWVDAYFPFTHPSLELEIYFQNNWLEVLGYYLNLLGCGVIQEQVLKNADIQQKGWAAGLGLERFAMLLFKINDIRQFWSEDKRFLDQYKDGKIVDFKQYSKYPSCYKDVSFFIPQQWEDNDLFEMIRNIGGDLIELVECIDSFTNKQGRTSKCFRIHFRSLSSNLTNQEIDVLQFQIRDQISKQLNVELR